MIAGIRDIQRTLVIVQACGLRKTCFFQCSVRTALLSAGIGGDFPVFIDLADHVISGIGYVDLTVFPYRHSGGTVKTRMFPRRVFVAGCPVSRDRRHFSVSIQAQRMIFRVGDQPSVPVIHNIPRRMKPRFFRAPVFITALALFACQNLIGSVRRTHAHHMIRAVRDVHSSFFVL